MKKVIVVFIVLFLSLIWFVFRWALFQEGNPIPIIAATFTIPFVEDWFASYWSGKYITNISNSNDRLETFMSKKGYTFTEQMWAWYFFKDKNWNKLLVIWKMYSRFFRVYYFDN